MCDYSLMVVPNRLAREGETLVIHRFPTGSLGLASAAEIRRLARPVENSRKNWLDALRNFFNPSLSVQVCAVCVPPGARLRLWDIPARLQYEAGVNAAEDVTFTQITASAHAYRDAVRFANGREVRLQDLKEGQRVRVRDLSCAGEVEFSGVDEERRLTPVLHR